MSNLLLIECEKLKKTFLMILFPIALIVPIALVLIPYRFQTVSLTQVVTKNSVFIQMISYAYVVISGCYMITREYKENTISYIRVTPQSLLKVLFCKYIVLFIEIVILQLFVYGSLSIINGFIIGFTTYITTKFLMAGLLSTIFLSCITPIVVFVSLWRKNFTSATLTFLILFMLTYPFAFMSYGYIFPHLIPIILVSKFLGYGHYTQISYTIGIAILAAVFIAFSYLSIMQVKKKG